MQRTPGTIHIMEKGKTFEMKMGNDSLPLIRAGSRCVCGPCREAHEEICTQDNNSSKKTMKY
jgi:hypothetical protein